MASKPLDPRWFKQAQRGLYDGKMRLVGNHVSPSKRHVRRSWSPNVQRTHLWSDIMQRSLSMNVTTSAMRQIDRVGGLDNYVLTTKQLHSARGEKLKGLLIKRVVAQAKSVRRQELGRIRHMYNAASEEGKAAIEASLRQQLMGGAATAQGSTGAAAAAPAVAAVPEQQMR